MRKVIARSAAMSWTPPVVIAIASALVALALSFLGQLPLVVK
jgi:hypothetical protein